MSSFSMSSFSISSYPRRERNTLRKKKEVSLGTRAWLVGRERKSTSHVVVMMMMMENISFFMMKEK